MQQLQESMLLQQQQIVNQMEQFSKALSNNATSSSPVEHIVTLDPAGACPRDPGPLPQPEVTAGACHRDRELYVSGPQQVVMAGARPHELDQEPRRHEPNGPPPYDTSPNTNTGE